MYPEMILSFGIVGTTLYCTNTASKMEKLEAFDEATECACVHH